MGTPKKSILGLYRILHHRTNTHGFLFFLNFSFITERLYSKEYLYICISTKNNINEVI